MSNKKHDFSYLSEMCLDFSNLNDGIIEKHFHEKQISYTKHCFVDYMRRCSKLFYTYSNLFKNYQYADELTFTLTLRTLLQDTMNVLYFVAKLNTERNAEKIDKLTTEYVTDQISHILSEVKSILVPKEDYYTTHKYYLRALKQFESDTLKGVYTLIFYEQNELVKSIEGDYIGKKRIFNKEDLTDDLVKKLLASNHV